MVVGAAHKAASWRVHTRRGVTLHVAHVIGRLTYVHQTWTSDLSQHLRPNVWIDSSLSDQMSVISCTSQRGDY